MTEKEFIVAIELGSSKITGVAGQKKPDGSISILAVAKEESSTFIRKGVVYNIDKTAQCLTNIVKKLEGQLKTQITQVFVGVSGQSIRSQRNVVCRDLPADTIITQDMVVELMDQNNTIDYPDQKLLDVAEQEYKVDTQLQLDPVGIRASHLEGNFLNILERKSFFQNLNKCFETANVKVADMYLAPLALSEAVLTEVEKRSGCALVDIGADTTTVSVFSKNVLRHLVVIPLGSNNITKDIESLQMEWNDAERMKLKYGSAFTENSEIDDNLKYSIDPDRQVDSRKFIDIVEGRMEEIIANVRYQIPNEYYDKLLGGIILTGGGANMKNIEKAFITHTGIDKVRVAKFVTTTINTSNDFIKAHNAMMNTVLGLVLKCELNCAGSVIKQNADLFESQQQQQQPQQPARNPRQMHEVAAGFIRSEREEEEARQEAERKRLEEERLQREADEQAARERERERRENSLWNKVKRAVTKIGSDIVSEE